MFTKSDCIVEAHRQSGRSSKTGERLLRALSGRLFFAIQRMATKGHPFVTARRCRHGQIQRSEVASNAMLVNVPNTGTRNGTEK